VERPVNQTAGVQHRPIPSHGGNTGRKHVTGFRRSLGLAPGGQSIRTPSRPSRPWGRAERPPAVVVHAATGSRVIVRVVGVGGRPTRGSNFASRITSGVFDSPGRVICAATPDLDPPLMRHVTRCRSGTARCPAGWRRGAKSEGVRAAGRRLPGLGHERSHRPSDRGHWSAPPVPRHLNARP